ncbi:alpha-galactosidase [Pontixanthobacter luteolus]|uniref:alpha-galactosidase n=1 Tax=Pontixanthobacter luteolus TaxID=295089 RepID=UPI002302C95B|nr:alpha-galactosidase [Pontixanthobacter luteolus]
MSEFLTLTGGGTQLILAASIGDRPAIVHWGPEITGTSPEELVALAARAHAPGGPEVPIAPSLLNPIGTGHPSPGILLHRAGKEWAADFRIDEIEDVSPSYKVIISRDMVSGLRAIHSFVVDTETGVLTAFTRLENPGPQAIAIESCAALCLPIDLRLNRLTGFSGRWANEFQTEAISRFTGSYLRENRSGRTSHDCYPGLYMGTETTAEGHGLAAAFHLGWSGNHRLRVDSGADGKVSLQMGELLLPGEIVLGRNGSYTTPDLFAAISADGYGDVTRRLHEYCRSNIRTGIARERPRPVHFNTWEAVYFDHSPEKLLSLAQQAAEIGAERFVLDDGWFGARRSDRAGLGDWVVSADVYPDGLGRIANRVRELGMEFGLWFEPEMVNSDSDLYRAHPDWVLQADGAEPIASRHQLPLDLTRSDVFDYLAERITSIVNEYGVGYIKWDMNRDIHHPGDSQGHAAVHRQTNALYRLIGDIRAQCPDSLEIESCSSGGARADWEILRRTDRVWTSDNNDARARYSIMRGAAHFLPLSMLGNHVGPAKCHITGRRFGMDFRAGTAVLGHMGMELDLDQETPADREILAAAIALHKQHRTLIHDGDYHRLETPSHISGAGAVSRNASEALFQIAVLDKHPKTHPPVVQFVGLDPDRCYRMECVWPEQLAGIAGTFAGSALMQYGLQLPQCWPDTCLIYHLEAQT